MSGYIGVQPVPQATQRREYFTATSGQATFNTNGYTPNYIDVYMNGVKLSPADFTASNGSDVVLASGATTGDLVQVVSFTPFNVANQTFIGDVNLSSGAYKIGGNTVIDSSRNATLAKINTTKIGDGDAGVLFNSHGGGDLDAILPFDFGNDSLYNGHVDIGGASNKFKDLHMSGVADVGSVEVGGTTVINSSQVGFLNEKTRIGTGATYPTDNAQLYIQRANNNPYIGFFSNDGSRNAYLQSNGSGAFYLNNAEGGGWAFNNSTSDVLSISNSGALTATSAEITLGNSLKLQNVAGNGYATIQNAGAGTNTDLGFSTGGSPRMTITHAGNVGIGESNTTALTNNLGTLLNVNSASIIGNGTSGAYFAFNARYNNSWLRTETSGVGIISLTNTGKLTYRTAASGNAETVPTLTEIIRTGDEDPSYVTFDGASQVRLTLGNAGTPGTNTANWIRGNAGYLQYNSASHGHSWEVGGTERMALTSGGVLHLQRGAVWDESFQGFTKGAIHIDPNSAVDDTGGAITFGASDNGSGETPHAGIYTRSDGAYGTKMYISTTDSYSTGPKTAVKIDHAGRVTTPRQPAFKAYLQADLAINEGTYYKVAHDGTDFNIGGHYSTSNTKFTAPVAGTYFFYATAIFEGFGTSENFRMTMQIRRNGQTSNKRGLATGGSANSVHDDNEAQISGLIYLNANDYVEHWVSKVGGTDSAGNIWGSSSSLPWTSFGGYLIG